MKGTEFRIEKLTQEIQTILLKPTLKLTPDIFELNFAKFSLQALQIAQYIISVCDLEKHIGLLFNKLIANLKQTRSHRPQHEQEAEIARSEDQITHFLNTRKPAHQSNNLDELNWHVNKMELKEKDTQNFLENLNKVKISYIEKEKKSNKMAEKKEIQSLDSKNIQTQIVWVNQMNINQQPSLKNIDGLLFSIPQFLKYSEKCNKKIADLEQKLLEWQKKNKQQTKVQQTQQQAQELKNSKVQSMKSVGEIPKQNNKQIKQIKKHRENSVIISKKNSLSKQSQGKRSMIIQSSHFASQLLRQQLNKVNSAFCTPNNEQQNCPLPNSLIEATYINGTSQIKQKMTLDMCIQTQQQYNEISNENNFVQNKNKCNCQTISNELKQTQKKLGDKLSQEANRYVSLAEQKLVIKKERCTQISKSSRNSIKNYENNKCENLFVSCNENTKLKDSQNNLLNSFYNKDCKKTKIQKIMSKLYTIHRQSQINDHDQVQMVDKMRTTQLANNMKLGFESISQKSKVKTIDNRNLSKLTNLMNKNIGQNLPKINNKPEKINKMRSQQSDHEYQKIEANNNIFNEDFEFSQNLDPKIIEKQLKGRQNAIVNKIKQLQKNGKNNTTQIRYYVQLMERMHRKYCGKQCKHLERFYKNVKWNPAWSNRVPITIATRKIGFFN